MLSRRIAILFLLSILICAPGTVFCKGISAEYQSHEYDKQSELHHYGSPRFTIGKVTITGSEMSYLKDSNLMEFRGNIIVYSENFVITAEKAIIDIKESKHVFFDTTFHDKKNNASGTADRIEQVSDTKYIIFRGVISTCDVNDRVVKINTGKIIYNVNDFAYSLNTYISFYSVPVFYTPFLSWPTREGRATGLLSPELINQTSSDESKQWGARLKLPYYFALDKDHDLTVTADLIERRGTGIGMEYRYAFRQGMRGNLNLWYLDEVVEDRNFEFENLGSKSSESDDLDKQPQRYTYSYNHRQSIFWGGTLTLNLLENSDNEVNKEYFDSIVEYDYYYNQTIDLSFPFLFGSLSANYSNAAKFTQESIYDDTTDKDTYLNKQPSVTVKQNFSNVWQTPFSVSLKGEWTDYKRRYGWNGQLTTGTISTSMPFHLDFLTVMPGYERTYYDYIIDYQYAPDEDSSSSIDDFPKHFGWQIDSKTLALSFETFRYFYNEENAKTAKLSFIPKVTFKETDDVEQLMPSGDFEIGSIVTSQKSITYQLDLIYKTKNLKTNTSRNFFTLSLVQPFDLNSEDCSEEDEAASFCVDHHPSNPEVDIGEQKLPLRLKLSLSPTSQLSGSLFYRYHHQNEKIVETRISLNTAYSTGSNFSLEYIENQDQYYSLDNDNNPSATSYKITSNIPFGDNLSLSLAGTWDLSRNAIEEKFADDDTTERLNRQLTSFSAGLSYKHRCFSYSIQYTENLKDTTEDDITKEYLSQKLKLSLTIPLIPGDQSKSLSEVPFQHELDI